MNCNSSVLVVSMDIKNRVDNCSICLEPVSLDKKVTLACLHIFDKACLNNWQKESDTCPLCRQKVVIIDMDIQFTAELVMNIGLLKKLEKTVISCIKGEEEQSFALSGVRESITDLENHLVNLYKQKVLSVQPSDIQHYRKVELLDTSKLQHLSSLINKLIDQVDNFGADWCYNAQKVGVCRAVKSLVDNL